MILVFFMINEVVFCFYNFGYYIIEVVFYMFQYKVQFYVVFDFLVLDKFIFRVQFFIMLNIFGGVKLDFYYYFFGLVWSIYDDDMDVYFYLYNKEFKFSCKIGYIIFIGFCLVQEFEVKVKFFIDFVD